MKKILPVLFLLGCSQILLLGQTIKMQKEGGVYKVPCKINGLSLSFIVDTGASNVMISLTEALFMLKNGYLLESDLSASEKYKIANGQIAEGTKVNLRSVQIGTNMLTNVEASVIHNIDAPLLFGLSALQRFGKVEMDYKLGTLTLGVTTPSREDNDNGVSKNNFQEFRGAIADYTRAIELSPDFPDAYYTRGLAKAELQDYRGAIADYTRAIELSPDDPDAYVTRGLIKVSMGQKDSGCLDFSKAGELGHSQVYDLIKEFCN